MKNKTFFNALFLAFAFAFFANAVQAQYMQTLYKVTSGFYIDEGKAISVTEANKIHISIYETAETKFNIAIITDLGNVGYENATWRKYGSYVGGSLPILGLKESNKGLRDTEFEATWKCISSDDKYNPFDLEIYLGQAKPATKILLIVYDEQGNEQIIYNAQFVFYGIIE